MSEHTPRTEIDLGTIELPESPQMGCRLCHTESHTAYVLCPNHSPAHLGAIKDDLLAALRELVDDLWFRLEAANEDCLVDDPPSWHKWLFSVMSTHGDIAEGAIAKAELPA